MVFEGEAAETARLSERELRPIPGSLSETPLSKIASLQVDTLNSFRAREGLLRAFQKIEHESAGIRALVCCSSDLAAASGFCHRNGCGRPCLAVRASRRGGPWKNYRGWCDCASVAHREA